MNQTEKKNLQSSDSLWKMAECHGVSRRTFLALLSGGGATAVLAACQGANTSTSIPQPQNAPLKDTEVIYASATALAKAIRTKQVSSVEVVHAYLQRIEAINPQLNAVVQLTAETALAQARELDAALIRGEVKGPLHGVPFSVKDNIETAGVICAAGTKGRATFVPKQDAPIVARMKAAGAIMLGKTNLPELGVAIETDNLVYGRTNNPYDLSRIPGGSSGGEAALIAAGGSPLGLGNDAGGSIRSPCHFCGISGIKPTSGRVPRTGHIPGFGGHVDSIWLSGPMARFVEDLSLTLPIVVGVDGRDPAVVPMPLGDPHVIDLKRLRAAFYVQLPLTTTETQEVVTPSPAVVAAVTTAAKALANAGVRIEEGTPPAVGQSAELWFRIIAADGAAGLKGLLQDIGTTEVSPLLRLVLNGWSAYAVSAAELIRWHYQWDLFRSAMLSFMDNYDVLLCPVNADAAPTHGVSFRPSDFPGFTYPMTYNLTGWLAAVVRAGTSSEGLPIGVQIVGRPWREDVVLAVAQHIETALGGWQNPNF